MDRITDYERIGIIKQEQIGNYISALARIGYLQIEMNSEKEWIKKSGI